MLRVVWFSNRPETQTPWRLRRLLTIQPLLSTFRRYLR